MIVVNHLAVATWLEMVALFFHVIYSAKIFSIIQLQNILYSTIYMTLIAF